MILEVVVVYEIRDCGVYGCDGMDENVESRGEVAC